MSEQNTPLKEENPTKPNNAITDSSKDNLEAHAPVAAKSSGTLKSILSKEEIEKIKAEEMLRKEIRQQLEEDKGESKNWKVLNSPLVLLIVSSVIIAGLGKIISLELENHRTREIETREFKRYLSELDYRIIRLNQFSEAVDTAKADSFRYYFSSGLIAVLNGDATWYTPIDSVFKNFSVISLTNWFSINRKEAKLSKQVIVLTQWVCLDARRLYDDRKRKELLSLLHSYRDQLSKEPGWLSRFFN